ncbi:hypothetical protein, partial [Roseobacter denitrificans]|uniref:hypothetical protein n=1 Tax=Roseobacter denitrificans TaxID=2434 RepID=UPI001C0C45C2
MYVLILRMFFTGRKHLRSRCRSKGLTAQNYTMNRPKSHAKTSRGAIQVSFGFQPGAKWLLVRWLPAAATGL